MPKIGMEPIRRRQIIDATMASIHHDGLGKTTIQGIAKRAGVASGLVLHYFTDKEQLFEAVYRDLYKRLSEETALQSKKAKSSKEKLMAILNAQVAGDLVAPEIVSTWFALGAKATKTPRLARLERANSARLSSNLIHLLSSMGLSRIQAKELSEELVALIYGLWCQLAHQTLRTPDQANEILFRYLSVRLR